jgi:hypothetical protein
MCLLGAADIDSQMGFGMAVLPVLRVRVLVLVLVLAMMMVVLPVDPVVAEEVAPETKGEVLDELVVEESDAVDEDEAESLDELASPARERSEVTAAPFPFTGLGFTGSGDAPVVRWRALDGAGDWTGWEEIESLDPDDGPDPDSKEAAEAVDLERRWVSDALWVGEATHLQVEVEGASLGDVDVTVMDSAGLSETLLQRVNRRIKSLGTAAPAEASTASPGIKLRADWGADETIAWRSGSPSYATPRFSVLHHTVTTNDYTRAQAPQQIRNMYYWHVNGNGWADIGYNFVVDKYGTIWEGRRGGITRGVIGAHAGGWNTGSFGIAIMGNHNTAAPSAAALRSLTDLLSWKYALHGIDTSASARASANGQSIPTLVGHRNLRGAFTANPSTTTDCPGQQLYTRMDTIRRDVASSVQQSEPVGVSVPDASGWTPVAGDWNGDGRETTGWFRNGTWRLRNFNSVGPVNEFRYGLQPGDLPVVGDWNGDGRTTVGIVRNGRWHLRNANTAGYADISFNYGRGSVDFPMAGDWNGNGRDTPAIVRDGTWHLRNSLSSGHGDIVFTYGRITRGDVPIVGDWNANGRDTPGILRDGTWHLRNSHSGGNGQVVFTYGRLTRGDLPIVGDWSRNGQTTIGITRNGNWHLRNSLTKGSADLTFAY